jgi:ABC-type multidrug transport system fused ATPase/permease subunit
VYEYIAKAKGTLTWCGCGAVSPDQDVAVSLAKQTLDNKSGGGDDRDKVDVLSARVTEGGANFSVGERQLLSIARGMLREAKVIILDEATSNVDGESDAKIQKVLRDVFVGSTSMTIAHRIETIADSFILVLDQGMVVEFDSPNALLERDSIFRQLVEQSESK